MTDRPELVEHPADDAAKLATEAREFLAVIITGAKQNPGTPNGVIVPWIPLRFALKDRIDRLCDALDSSATKDAAWMASRLREQGCEILDLRERIEALTKAGTL